MRFAVIVVNVCFFYYNAFAGEKVKSIVHDLRVFGVLSDPKDLNTNI